MSNSKRRPLTPATEPAPHIRQMTTAVLTHRVGAGGQCSDTGDSRPYFPDHINGHARRRLAEHARQACAGCPVRGECLELALRIEAAKPKDCYGIWGGTAPGERRRLLRARTSATRAVVTP